MGEKKEKKFFNPVFLILWILVIACIIGGFIFYGNTFSSFASLGKDAINKQAEEISSKIDELIFNQAEAYSHNTNNVHISIEKIEEIGKLEVLQVKDSVYVSHQEEWGDNYLLEVIGSGEYTVDLRASEYIIDRNNNSVLVRIPKPELCNLRREKAELLHYDNSFLNSDEIEAIYDLFFGDTKQGQEMARNAVKDGEDEVFQQIRENYGNSDIAIKCAKRIIKEKICEFNPDVENLTVEVEVME